MSKNIETRDKKIKELEKENKELKELMNYWHNKFVSVFNFIKDKMFGKKEERETYIEMAFELNRKKIFDDESYDNINKVYSMNVKYDKIKKFMMISRFNSKNKI